MMKAAVLKELGKTPHYEDFDIPTPSDGETVMEVKAVALKNIDKLLASGKHYAGYKKTPVVVGMDGVGILEEGTPVYAKGITGTLAGKTLIAKNSYVTLPEDIDLALAAALPNAAMGSYLPLLVKGQLKKGDIVLINGGTGVTGKLAIQLAKHYGASKVIVTGRIEGRENHLKDLGADELISTTLENKAFVKKLKQINTENPIQMVVDYLWGKPTELILESFFKEGGKPPKYVTKVITVGSMAGDEIKLSSNNLRSGRTEIIGSGLGSYTAEQFQAFNQEILPEIFRLAADDKLHIDLQKEKLENIASVWNMDAKGKRIVVEI